MYRWAVELIDIPNPVRRWTATDGVAAITSAQRLHRNDQRPGSVYVLTPTGGVYLVQDNGLTRVGF